MLSLLEPMQITKKKADHIIKMSETCGRISEVLKKGDYPALDLAIVADINSTVGHSHATFDEIYVLAHGSISVEFYDPASKRRWTDELQADELCVIRKGIHHKVVDGSVGNKLMVICVPGFDMNDEQVSSILES